MSDAIDQAQRQSELMLQNQIRKATHRVILPTRTHCIDCDEPILPLRRQAVAGCQRCITCQTNVEKTLKLTRG